MEILKKKISQAGQIVFFTLKIILHWQFQRTLRILFKALGNCIQPQEYMGLYMEKYQKAFVKVVYQLFTCFWTNFPDYAILCVMFECTSKQL